ncbi:Nitrogen assimilation regulatory protein [Aquisphaera giovannonii]|uniref:Nitrogen assimilation regulatory protein n=1 Tax=Aquisphaera giovannonii TaxID=406548 RepID=A0A5B9W665_9BACT|nr:sigma 54-interacting transcriptional regulator [Aquisphaera giovannonii]QEH36028.1 Nitrogen assimilation regulatory protein [Aquisphaera giovannonii]
MAVTRGSAFRPEQLWQQAREPMFWLDPALRIVWVNRAWEALTGQSAEAVIGRTCGAHGPDRGGDPIELAASLSPPPEALAGAPAGTTALVPIAGGEPTWRRLEFWPFRDQQGATLGLLGQVRPAEEAASVPESRAHALRVRLMELRERLHRDHGIDSLIGSGPAHDRLMEQVKVAGASDAPVLLVGEPGTGKRLVARVIHGLGQRRHRPLVPIDCEALPADVLERELFASPRPGAADDGADGPPADGPARLAMPEGSALLLGDILATPRDLQARLAAAIQPGGRARDPLAGAHDGPAEGPEVGRGPRGVRVIATTAGDFEEASRRGLIRPDFSCAVSVLVLRLPPLRERAHDLPVLAQHFLERANRRTGGLASGFTARAMAALRAYDWPGNLRELDRVVAAAERRFGERQEGAPASAADGGPALVDVADLPASIRGHLAGSYLPPAAPRGIQPLDELLTEIERRLIESALSKARQNKSRAAEILGISRPRLYRRIKELNLPDADDADPGVGEKAEGREVKIEK